MSTMKVLVNRLIEVKSQVKCIICFLMLLSIATQTEAGSCREASLCCNGRDSSCVVQKTPINAIVEDLNEKPCYCDHACLKLGDCCEDFKSHCGVIDCLLSEWGSWSECDAKCGTGMMSRTRTILRAPENGGKHCASLTQKRGCQGYKCHNHNYERKALGETAMLLPSEFSKSRRENDTTDIRRNLRLRYTDLYKHNRDHEYCIEFEVIKATKACRKDPIYKQLAEGDRIVVKCDLEAFLPHDDKDSDDNSANEVISHNKNLENETIEDYKNIKKLSKSKSKYRCRGEGSTGRNTRFSSMAIPSCHGKWMRLTVGQPKKCSYQDSQFIFV